MKKEELGVLALIIEVDEMKMKIQDIKDDIQENIDIKVSVESSINAMNKIILPQHPELKKKILAIEKQKKEILEQKAMISKYKRKGNDFMKFIHCNYKSKIIDF